MFSIENIFHNLHLVDIKRLMVDRITKYLTMKRGKNSCEAINDIVLVICVFRFVLSINQYIHLQERQNDNFQWLLSIFTHRCTMITFLYFFLLTQSKSNFSLNV